MANHKAKEPRVFMRVPESFRDQVLKKAHAIGMKATVFMEKSKVTYEG